MSSTANLNSFSFSFLRNVGEGLLACSKCCTTHKRITECAYTVKQGPSKPEIALDDIVLEGL